jgi:hypothetical protein
MRVLFDLREEEIKALEIDFATTGVVFDSPVKAENFLLSYRWN